MNEGTKMGTCKEPFTKKAKYDMAIARSATGIKVLM